MSQTDDILAWLRKHPEGLTPIEALAMGFGMRLAARISDAKALLKPVERIVTVTEAHDGGTHARYILIGADNRMFREMSDWERFAVSEHRRHGHAPSVKRVEGCEWCIRWAAIDAAFRGEPQEKVPDPDVAWAGSLWDAA